MVKNGHRGRIPYKFNIINFSKSGVLFEKGMKITVFSKQANL